jgi:hypothetical protein
VKLDDQAASTAFLNSSFQHMPEIPQMDELISNEIRFISAEQMEIVIKRLTNTFLKDIVM